MEGIDITDQFEKTLKSEIDKAEKNKSEFCQVGVGVVASSLAEGCGIDSPLRLMMMIPLYRVLID